MEKTVTQSGPVVTISLIGQLWNKDELKELDNDLSLYASRDTRTIVIDVSRLSFISSQGLGLLVRGFARLKEMGIRMFLSNPRDSVLEVIELSGFDLFMTVARTEQELLEALGKVKVEVEVEVEEE
jgi:anti-anti-sigma factor